MIFPFNYNFTYSEFNLDYTESLAIKLLTLKFLPISLKKSKIFKFS